MGILGKMTPERAKMAIVIASTMQSMCHDCPNCRETRIFGKKFKEPNIEDVGCLACLDSQRKKIFGVEQHDDNARNV